MRILYGASRSEIKVWQGWQFQKPGKETYFVLWDGSKMIYGSKHGMSISDWQDVKLNGLIRRLIRYIFEADKIQDER